MRRDLIVRGLSEATYSKLLKRKEQDGFKDKDFGTWVTFLVQDINLVDSPSELIQHSTRDSMMQIWIQNVAKNLPTIWESDHLNELVPEACKKAEKQGKNPDFPTGSAVVVGRGPSLFQKKHLDVLAKSDYAGTVVCTDGALIDALKAGVDPTKYENFLSVSVDGDRQLIRKWYDHELVTKYGPSIKVVVSSSVANNVVELCKKIGSKVYFFHPVYDDWRKLESYTKIHQYITQCEKHPNGVPAMMAGGHAGATAWILSWLVLRKSPVGLIGLNLGYLPDEPLESTYYWKGMMIKARGNIAAVQSAFEKVYNPDFKCEALMDPVFKHYRGAFFDMLETTPRWLHTINCTEGGALFGPGIEAMPFSEFLSRYHK